MKCVRLDELQGFVREVVALLPLHKQTAVLVALSGDLGAGKTTFVQALGKELGVLQTMQSPTYVLMKKYALTHQVFKTLVHIDAYRLNNPQEFSTLKPEEFLNDPTNLVVVEWPERLGAALPKPDLTLSFSAEDAKEGERYIELTNG